LIRIKHADFLASDGDAALTGNVAYLDASYHMSP